MIEPRDTIKAVATRNVLPVIILSQFFCTSLWFAGNAIMPDLLQQFHLPDNYLAHMTSAVQFGFITGTLVIAVLAIADRFSPSRVFFICAILAAMSNLAMIMENIPAEVLLLCRFLAGFFLAGIYPVGMKIAADHYQEKLGKALGFLVGALVLGTALPHVLKSFMSGLPWNYVITLVSLLAVSGGLLMLCFVPNGPYRKPGKQLKPVAFGKDLSAPGFRASAFGYFGHMWELYSFWAFVPVMLAGYNQLHSGAELSVPVFSFLIIGSGAIACMLSGWLSQYFGARRIAFIALFLSGICCICSPLFLFNSAPAAFLGFLFFWGLVVIADSPLFSTLVAQNADKEIRGSALTIVNCIGFSITIISIQLLNALSGIVTLRYLYMLLAIGPIFGLWALRSYRRSLK